MKKSLDFCIHTANYLEKANFIQRFASAYVFIEASRNPAVFTEYAPDKWNGCVGCSSGGEAHCCKKDNAAAKRCTYFALFNTLCGNSALRRRFDGSPTDMQQLTGEWDRNCGADFTVDFLFGFAGYTYRKCTDPAAFKQEIMAGIDAGTPVIAKTHACAFQLITGYDGDSLLIPPYVYYDYTVTPPVEKWEQAPEYGDIDALYIFGDRTERRYTLKDGLHNIRRVMQYNIGESLWDEYLTKLGGWDKFPSEDGLDKASAAEKQARAQQWAATNLYMYNNCSTSAAFFAEKIPNHYLASELSDPALKDLWDQMDAPIDALINAGHKTGRLSREHIWDMDDTAKLSELSAEACQAIASAQAADAKVLDVINQAIAYLETQNK